MKRIIILEAVPGSAQGYRFALWAAVPSERQHFYANPTFESAWKGPVGTQISAQELADLRSGAVAEKIGTFNNETAQTLAQVKEQLEAVWTAYQAFVTAHNPWDRYGSFWDDTPAWTNNGAN